MEFQSLALLGKLAMNDVKNKYQKGYNQVYSTEEDIGLKLAEENEQKWESPPNWFGKDQQV